MPLFGNAVLTGVSSEVLDTYDVPTDAVTTKWTGRAVAHVVDRTRTVVDRGEVNRFHETVVFVPSRMIDDAGNYLAFQPGDYLTVEEDGKLWRYRVEDYTDWGQRVLGSPSDVQLVVERLGA